MIVNEASLNQRTSSTLKSVLTFSLYGVAVAIGTMAGLMALLIVA